ncbi:MAG: hypothetical protein LAT84_08955 [Balneolia bacterium]|nr:hypothetical protein [Balneolia bacterium]
MKRYVFLCGVMVFKALMLLAAESRAQIIQPISGYSVISGETMNRSFPNSNIDVSYIDWEFQGSASFLGVPVTASGLLSSFDGPAYNYNRLHIAAGMSREQANLLLRQRIIHQIDALYKERWSPGVSALRAFEIDLELDKLSRLQATGVYRSEDFALYEDLGLLSENENRAIRFPLIAGIGSKSPSYSTRNTLSGVLLTGFNAELDTPFIFAKANVGTIRNPAFGNPFSFLGQDFGYNDRNLLAVRGGFGRPETSHIHAVYITSEALSEPSADANIQQGSLFQPHLAPNSTNFVVGISASAGSYDGLTLGLSANASGISYSGAGQIGDTPPRDSESFGDIALEGNAKLRVNNRNTIVHASFDYTGPEFASLSVGWLRRDLLRHRAGFEHRFLSRQLMIGAEYSAEQNNLSGNLSSEFETLVLNFRAGLFLHNLPYLIVSYSPAEQTFRSSSQERIDNRTNTDFLTFIAGHQFRIGELTSVTSGHFSLYETRYSPRELSLNGSSIGITQQFQYSIFGLRGHYESFSSSFNGSENHQQLISGGISMMVYSGIDIEAGGSSTLNDNSITTTGIYLSAIADFQQFGQLEVKYTSDRFREAFLQLPENQYDISRLRIIFRHSWN